MFISVKRKSRKYLINSNIINSISVKLYLSKADSNGINKVSFKVCIKDNNNNIYYTKNIECENELNLTEDTIEDIILSTIEVLINSNNALCKTFEKELQDRLLLKLNKK